MLSSEEKRLLVQDLKKLHNSKSNSGDVVCRGTTENLELASVFEGLVDASIVDADLYNQIKDVFNKKEQS